MIKRIHRESQGLQATHLRIYNATVLRVCEIEQMSEHALLVGNFFGFSDNFVQSLTH